MATTASNISLSGQPSPSAPDGQTAYRNFMIIVAIGAFATTFAQTQIIGLQPLRYLLKTYFGMDRTGVSAFVLASGMAWYFKPLAGLVSDAVPLFGTRRRSYMIVSAALASVCWVIAAAVSHNKTSLWTAVLLLNVFMVIASTAMGALLVEGGQKYGATGRLSSTREFVQGAATLISGPIAGYLATRWFGYTAGIGAATLMILAVGAFFFLKEKPTAQFDKSVFTTAQTQIKNMSKSRTLWAAVGLLILVFIAPGFGTPLFFLQTDTLKFTQREIGILTLLSGLGSIFAAMTYGWVCKRLSLRTALYAGMVINASGSLIYLLYHSYHAASVIDFLNGYLSILGVLPVYDLAVRSVPAGSEGLGFSLMMSARNLALNGSDTFGSYLLDHFKVPFSTLVLLNSGTTLLVLIAIPFLPAALMRRRDGEHVEIPVASKTNAQPEGIWPPPVTFDEDAKS